MPLTSRLRLFAILALILVPLSLLHIIWRLIANAGSVILVQVHPTKIVLVKP